MIVKLLNRRILLRSFFLVIIFGTVASVIVSYSRETRNNSKFDSLSSKSLLLVPLSTAREDGSQVLENGILPDIFGTVKDESGAPLKGALIRAVCVASETYLYSLNSVNTTEEGTYSYEGLLPNQRYKLIASMPGFSDESSKEFLFDKPKTEINFMLPKIKSFHNDNGNIEIDELPVILSGITSSLDNYRSGRIVYILETSSTPVYLSNEEIEMNIKRSESHLRERGLSEDAIADHIGKFRRFLERTVAQGGSVAYTCEYIFEGENSYSSVVEPNPRELTSWRRMERYFKNGTETIITEEKVTDWDNIESWRTSAEVRTTSFHPSRQEFESPIGHLKKFREWFSTDGWAISDIHDQSGNVVYSIENNTYHNLSVKANIVPDKQFSLAMVRRDYINNPSRFQIHRFDDIRWDAATGVYYPHEIIVEDHNTSVSGEDRIHKMILTLQEFDFNIEIPDTTFTVPFIEGMTVIDFRFDPPKQYIHKYPEAFDEYVKSIDESAKALESKDP